MRQIVVLLLTLALLLGGSMIAVQASTPERISGSFIQLNGQLASFSEGQWEEELGYMKAIGMDTVIVQYSVYGDHYYYSSKYAAKASGPGLDESINELTWKGSARARYVKIVIEPTSVEWTMLTEVTVSRDGAPISPGVEYTISPEPNPKYRDADGKKLTDGRANWSWNDMVGWQNPIGPITVVVDLGKKMPFNSVSAKFMRSEISNVQLPEGGFSVFVYNNGDSFMPAGKVAWKEGGETGGEEAIENILSAAEKLGMNVFLGLGLNPEFWSGKFDAQKEAAVNQKTMTELQKLYSNYTSLAGWYLPEELDDRNFNTDEKKEVVIAYLKSMVMYARFYTHRPVMVSPYFGMNPDGAAYAQWWDDVLSEAKLDIVAMQDGVGCHRTSVEESAAVLRALRPVMEEHGVQLWANAEVFDQTHGWPVDDLDWRATSAPIDRVIKQLDLESPYVDKVIIFDFTSYMSPRLGDEAQALYEGYEEYLSRR